MKIEILKRVDKNFSVIVYQNDMLKDVYIYYNFEDALEGLKYLYNKGGVFDD